MIDLKLFTYKLLGYLLVLLGGIFLVSSKGYFAVVAFLVGSFLIFKSKKQRVILMTG